MPGLTCRRGRPSSRTGPIPGALPEASGRGAHRAAIGGLEAQVALGGAANLVLAVMVPVVVIATETQEVPHLGGPEVDPMVDVVGLGVGRRHRASGEATHPIPALHRTAHGVLTICCARPESIGAPLSSVRVTTSASQPSRRATAVERAGPFSRWQRPFGVSPVRTPARS